MEERVGIIGLGYVGLPLVREFVKQGLTVVGFDVDDAKVKALSRGESYLRHIDAALVKGWVAGGRFTATHDFSRLEQTDAILICVPTPLTQHREPDLSYVVATCETVAAHLKKGQLVVLESTTYPGTTTEVMQPILESTGLRAGVDFYLAYSPEREDPGNRSFSTASIPKVVGGHTPACLERAVSLYRRITEVVPVSSTQVAEAAKILENTYRAVNIALVNELKMLFDSMEIDIWEVIAAASSKPFGFHPFYPGPGLGGHCIPIDPFYLTWKAKELDIRTRFIELAGEINSQQPHYVVQKAVDALNRHGKSIKGSKVLIIGMAYKKDIDDVRESPSLKIYDLLQRREAVVAYYDPYVPETGPHRHYPQVRIRSIAYSASKLASFDLVLIVTDHSGIPYDEILDRAQLIVDTRNVFPGGHPKVIKA